jgi:hypothetical protein
LEQNKGQEAVIEEFYPVYELPAELLDRAGLNRLLKQLRDAAGELERFQRDQDRDSHLSATQRLESLAQTLGGFQDGVSRSVTLFGAVLILLAWFASMGMLLPLARLPASTTDKIFLLSGSGLGIVGLGGFFIWELRRLHRLRRLFWSSDWTQE